MKNRARICLLSIIIFILSGFSLVQAVESKGKSQVTAKSLRVLFIGNSHTYCNNLTNVLSKMATSGDPSVIIQATEHAPGGCTLERHWLDGEALKLIQQGGWDFVVLQENGKVPLLNPEKMREYAGRFEAEIKKVNARTILFMTAAHQDRPETTEKIAEIYNDIGEKLNAKVAPVGLAFKKSLEKRPDLILHDLPEDTVHANQCGTYLTGCVFYAVLTGRNPRGLSNAGLDKVTRAQAEFLQQIAWETVRSRTKNSDKNAESKDKK